MSSSMLDTSSPTNFLYSLRHGVLLLVIGTIIWLQWASYRRLSNFKGPFWARLTSWWLSRAVASERQHLELFEVSQKYGDLARIGPNLLLTCNPDLVMRMSSARSPYKRAPWYSGQKLQAGKDNIFSLVDEQAHAKRRAQMAIGYSGKEIVGLEGMVDKHLLEFMALIRRKYIATGSDLKPMDLAQKAGFFTMDVITDIGFGHTWGCLRADADVAGWFESFELNVPFAFQVSAIPWIQSFCSIPLVGKMIFPSDKDENGPGRLLGIAKDIVKKRFREVDPGHPRDMLGSFIRHGITETQAVTETSLQIGAGGDTTATTIRSTMLHIITNPLAYRALQDEIDSVKYTDAIISDEQAKTLPYLQAVIKEGARMYPAGTGLMSKVVPPEGDTINGTFIPGGTEIGECFWGVQRNQSVYGADAMLFRPERWLEATGERLERMEKTVHLIWGHGKYQCLGKPLAFMELNKAFFELLKNFDFTLIDPNKPWTCKSYGLWIQKDMWVKVTERTRKEEKS